MEKIASFRVNHLALLPGVYVSRRDTFGAEGGEGGEDAAVAEATTFDVRMTAPNREAPLSPRALHAMEHLAATFLRNHPVWGSEIVYWGPMGCCTGNYLIVKGHREPHDLLPLLGETFRFIAGFEGEIPGATPRDCGNYSFMDLEGAREAARRFLAVLDQEGGVPTQYPE